MILRDVEEGSITVQLYFIVENLGWNSITNPTRFRITTGRHHRNRNSKPHEWWESVVVTSRWWRRGMRRYQVYTKWGSHAVHATYSGTEGKRDSPRFDSLFFCMRCRRNIGMHQWYKLLRKACIFCFRDRTYSYDEYFCIYCCTRYVCHPRESLAHGGTKFLAVHTSTRTTIKTESTSMWQTNCGLCPLCCIRAYHMFCMLQIVAGRMYVVWYE